MGTNLLGVYSVLGGLQPCGEWLIAIHTGRLADDLIEIPYSYGIITEYPVFRTVLPYRCKESQTAVIVRLGQHLKSPRLLSRPVEPTAL